MPRLTPLPENLKYLQPFRRQVAMLKPEEIDESMDLSLLHRLLRERIRDLPGSSGKSLLENDARVLEGWLSSKDLVDNGAMWFLRGYFMGLPNLVDYLLDEQNKEMAQQTVSMGVPSGARTQTAPGDFLVEWAGATLIVEAVDQKRFDMFFPPFHGPECLGDTIVPVQFGSIKGFKVAKLDDSSRNVGSHQYAFEVAGGFLLASVTRSRVKADLSQFESWFHTLRIETTLAH